MSKVVLTSNLESVATMVGALEGISDGISADEYMDTLLRRAHGKAKDVFDISAAATAATGKFTHMYEFGTAGITRGKSTFNDPTSPAARLYNHEVIGKGKALNAMFTFRPAVARNPMPTTKDTGISSRYLRKLSKRKYVFWNKAAVVETGTEVSIKNRDGNQFLFVPASNSPRKFVFWHTPTKGPIRTVPGKNTAGTFTAFWTAWWASEGDTLVYNHARASLAASLRWAQNKLERDANAQKMKPVNNIKSTAAQNRKKYKGEFIAHSIRSDVE